MPDYFYQIKVRKYEYDPNEFWATRWHFPPVFSGKVTANDRKEARSLIEEEYNRNLPMRVVEKDIEKEPYLLNIMEIKPSDTRTAGLFEIKECKNCLGGFRVIDHYNNSFQSYKGNEFCCDECKSIYTTRQRNEEIHSSDCGLKKHNPVIYKIENHKKKMVYIGQTTQAFTLRWWQHFFHGTDTKFHKEIKSSNLTDWSFCILETIRAEDKPEGMSSTEYMNGREQHWIDFYDSIQRGYNTATAKC